VVHRLQQGDGPQFIEEAANWARKIAKAAAAVEEIVLDDENKNILAYRIRFASGHKIVALSSRPSNLRGKDSVVIIDEAALHPDLDGLLKAALAYEVWGGRIHITSTHLGADNPFNELVTDIRAGRHSYSLHRTTIDDAIADGSLSSRLPRHQKNLQRRSRTGLAH
jgi:phage FluMu gp28-like protein